MRSQLIRTPSRSASSASSLVGRHLLARAPVDDHRLVGAQAPGDARGVHRGVAAAVDRDPPADLGPLAGGDAAQERHCIDDPAGIASRDVDPLRQVGADRDEDRVEAALLALGGEVFDPMVAARCARPARRSGRARRRARHGAGDRRGCRTASCRRARRPRRGSRPRVPAGPGGRRPRARSAPSRSPAPAGRCVSAARRTASPSRAPGRRGSARPNGSRRRCRGWRGCNALARVVADPAVDRRQRIVGDEFAPRLLVLAGLVCDSHAWMFSPAGQPELHGGSRST